MIPSKTAKLDVEKLRKWIGHEEQGSDVITTDLIRKFYATFDLEEPVPEMGQTAPRLIHFCLAQAIAPTVALGTVGHPRKGHFLPPRSSSPTHVGSRPSEFSQRSTGRR
jgi:3-methylfumaryl-CoA hydratase